MILLNPGWSPAYAAAGGGGGPSFVQDVYGHDQGNNGTQVASITGLVSGNILVAVVHWAHTTETLTSVTKSGGTATVGSWTTQLIHQGSSTASAVSWAAISGNGTADVTTLLSGTANSNTFLIEVSGAHASAPINAYAGQRLFSNSTATDFLSSGTTPSGTTDQNNCLIIGAASVNNSALSAGTNFTSRENHSSTWGGYLETLSQAVAGSIAATFTDATAAGENCGISMVAIRGT